MIPKSIPIPWLRNTAGRPDAMLSIAVAFALVGLASFAFGGSTYDGHGLHLQLPALDVGGVGALASTLSAYVVRRKHGAGPAASTGPAAPAAAPAGP